MAGSIARISLNSSRPRRPGICSSSSTTLYGCRRSSASASSPCVADATVKPCSSRKRRCAASPSISSSTQRMLFGRGIVAKANTRDYNWPRVVRPARALQLHRRHPAHHAPRPRAAAPASRGADRLRHEAGHDPPRLGQPARPRRGGPGAGRADPPPRPPAAGAPAHARSRPARQRALADAPLIALAPGAAHATKRWPLAHWIALADRLRAAGYRPVVLGGSEDRGLAQQLAEGGGTRGGPIESAAGEFSLQETGALLGRARALVSGDTGVMHMATGVGTPVVALFGPTVGQFGFFPYRAPAVVLERPLDCRPCSATGTAHCPMRSEEHTSELQSPCNLVCRLLLEKK